MYTSTTPPIIGALIANPSTPVQSHHTFSSYINLHISIDAVHYYKTLQLQASTNGVAIFSILDALNNLHYSSPDSTIYIVGENTVEITPSIQIIESYIKPKVWVDGTVLIEAFVTNEKEATLDISQDTMDDPLPTEESKRLRSRERKISEVFEKVSKWREIYMKLKSQMPSTRKLSEKAAEIVGIPKKSLDDYMHQIKLGKQFNFDFNKNLECMIGELRRYNKREENKLRHHYKRSW